jgi:hypothetical protein
VLPSIKTRLFADRQADYFISSGRRDDPEVVLHKVVHHQAPRGVIVFDNKACRLTALCTNPLARCAKRLESSSTGPTRFTVRRLAITA